LSEAQAELRQQKLEELRGDETDETSEVSGVENSSASRKNPSENVAGANEAEIIKRLPIPVMRMIVAAPRATDLTPVQ
jgi:hypothetical protein